MYSATIDPSSLPRNWRFTFPFCSCNQERHSFCATWKCQTRARLRKKEAYQLPLKSEQRKKLSVEGTDYIHFTACTMHSMFRALFGVPHLFARELLMNSPHWVPNTENTRDAQSTNSTSYKNHLLVEVGFGFEQAVLKWSIWVCIHLKRWSIITSLD